MSLFFFFKQKTAYEMRISDWSSDVCSSDLFLVISYANITQGFTQNGLVQEKRQRLAGRSGAQRCQRKRNIPHEARGPGVGSRPQARRSSRRSRPAIPDSASPRSEEPTSELQSLMRHTYDVFC